MAAYTLTCGPVLRTEEPTAWPLTGKLSTVYLDSALRNTDCPVRMSRIKTLHSLLQHSIGFMLPNIYSET
jgi:hypothetical protein